MADRLTTAQVAEIYGISDATVRQTILRGSIQAEKTKAGWRIERDEAERFWGGDSRRDDIEDGLRLLYSLRDGSTDVLFEMFPDLEEHLIPDPPKPDDSDPDLKKKVDFHDQVIAQIIANGLQAPTTYHMKSSEPAAGVMKPPGATAFGGTKVTIDRDPDGKGNGAAANNLLDSIKGF